MAYARTLAILLFSAGSVAGSPARPTGPLERYHHDIEPILDQYCFECHGDGQHKGQLAFDQLKDEKDLLGNRALWLSVLRYTRAGLMPAQGEPGPERSEMDRLESWIKSDVFLIDPANLDPGHVTLRRLNRVEYRNTVRDLMGVDFDSDVEFPPDDTGNGFDNLGDILTVAPLLLEKYLQAAEAIVNQAVPLSPPSDVAPGDLTAEQRRPELSFARPGHLSRRFEATAAGNYGVHFGLSFVGPSTDLTRCSITLKVDGKPRKSVECVGAYHHALRFEGMEKLKPGPHFLAIDVNPLSVPEGAQPAAVRVDEIELVPAGGRATHFSRDDYLRYFPDGPAPRPAAARTAYARAILRQFCGRAFRRPADEAKVDQLAAIARSVSDEPGKTFEQGIARAMMVVLASPRFLFRIESPLPSEERLRFARIDDYSLASRLSYFLWSSMPDQTLMDDAARGTLRSNLPAEVKRMLADSRSEEWVRNFTGQWLQARDIEFVPIDLRLALGLPKPARGESPPQFETALRHSMRRETEMVFSYILRGDRSVKELIESDYTYLDQRLAEHYGITGVATTAMQRVALAPDSPRGGVLTEGTILAVTSNPNRTSPVKRGQFILDSILGTPAPPPPPNVPALEEAAHGIKGHSPSLRQMLEIHRREPVCASCHSRMDPPGFALENFSAAGTWRDHDGRHPIDASGTLATGETFHDAREMKHILATEHLTDFERCLTEKMLTYALGRGLQDYDVETVDRIVSRLHRSGGRLSALVLGIAESVPFQKQRNPLAPGPAAVVTRN
jgi:mono/diheme cytochrome c family protein